MTRFACLAVVLGLAGALAGCGSMHGKATTSTASKEKQRAFFTPGANGASCEMDVGLRVIPTSVFCLVGPPQVPVHKAASVTLNSSGHLTICHGLKCMSNGEAPTLHYGRSIVVGPFRCTALRAGARCVVESSGRGFLIGASGVRPVAEKQG